LVDFRVRHLARSRKDNCLYAQARKAYTRTKPIKSGYHQEKQQPRIKATIIKLSCLGYSINQLARAFGRSTSFVHKCVRTSIIRGLAHFIDKRKLPATTRLRTSSLRRKMLSKFIIGWLQFARGEVDKPP
jgi:hypothetical protein